MPGMVAQPEIHQFENQEIIRLALSSGMTMLLYWDLSAQIVQSVACLDLTS